MYVCMNMEIIKGLNFNLYSEPAVQWSVKKNLILSDLNQQSSGLKVSVIKGVRGH